MDLPITCLKHGLQVQLSVSNHSATSQVENILDADSLFGYDKKNASGTFPGRFRSESLYEKIVYTGMSRER